jgi:hypothetical protein
MGGAVLTADMGDQLFGRKAHVARKQFTGSIRVARDRGVHDGAQLGYQIAFARGRRRRSAVITQFLDLQHLPYTPEPDTVAARHQHVEERMVKRNEASIEAPLRSRLQGRCPRELMECRNQTRLPAHVAGIDGVPQAELLDLDAGGGQVAQILCGNRRDAKAALRPRFDQPLRGEARQRFAHGPLAGIEALAQLPDTQGFAGLKTAIQQGFAQQIVGALGKAGGSHYAAWKAGEARCLWLAHGITAWQLFVYLYLKYILKQKVYKSILGRLFGQIYRYYGGGNGHVG